MSLFVIGHVLLCTLPRLIRSRLASFFKSEEYIYWNYLKLFNLTTHSSALAIFMAFALGVRHGFDLDHIATIDAMTRTLKEYTRLSKWVGFLFSVGHGLVVILMSLMISSGMVQTKAPLWLAEFGSWVSIVFLWSFGLMTFWTVLAKQVQLPSGIRVIIFRKLLGKNNNPLFIMLIGALFALSFDTFTQVALFSLSASIAAGLFFAMMLAIVFMTGMIAADGLNGFFVSSFIQHMDKRSKLISKIIGLSIALFSVVLGALGLGTLLSQ